MKPGDRARFFDSQSEWARTGDVGDNDIYFMPATVISVYWRGDEELADIKFDHKPDRISRGHFTTFTRGLQRVVSSRAYRSDTKLQTFQVEDEVWVEAWCRKHSQMLLSSPTINENRQIMFGPSATCPMKAGDMGSCRNHWFFKVRMSYPAALG